MKIQRLELQHFRNYEQLSLNLPPGTTAFLGANAQGKTNILEAIVLASLGRSHRTSQEEDLIAWEQAGATVGINFERLEVQHRLDVRLSRQGRKEILFNGHPIKAKDLIGQLNIVLFSPEDLLLVKGVPALRRRFLDMEISQASPTYYRRLLRYHRFLQQRNLLLKRIRNREQSLDALDSWDEGLAGEAAGIVTKRREAIKKINMLANLMHRRITANQESLAVKYSLHGMDEDGAIAEEELTAWYREQLHRRRTEDIARGITTIGPHRDDLLLAVNGNSLRAFGSQGQQRTGVLALKLAELEFIRSETGEYPILLLDDVMSELDASRREHLLGFIKDRVQTLITATDDAYLPVLAAERKVQIRGGTVQRCAE